MTKKMAEHILSLIGDTERFDSEDMWTTLMEIKRLAKCAELYNGADEL